MKEESGSDGEEAAKPETKPKNGRATKKKANAKSEEEVLDEE